MGPGAGRPGGDAHVTARPRPLILAHRGDHRLVPENTLDAFLAGLAVPGCDGLELDVRVARDGTPVVIHDPTLARVQGRPDRVGDLSTAELASLGVPTLREVLAVVPRRAYLDVELKEDVGAAVVPLLRSARGDPPEGVVISSFDAAVLRTVRALAPDQATWLNVIALGPRGVRRAAGIGCRGIAAQHRSIRGPSTALAHAAGLDVAAWTVRGPRALARLARLGVVAVCVEAAALDDAETTLRREGIR